MAGNARWWEADDWPQDLASFGIVIHAFLERRISAVEFERLYLDLFGGDRYRRSEGAFRSLEAMFFAVDEFEYDDALRGENDLDEEGLREVAVASFERLRVAKGDSHYRAEYVAR